MSPAGFRRLIGTLGKAANRARCSTTRHKNIQHTVRYTELSPERFKDLWKD
jgi:hypothetical protein